MQLGQPSADLLSYDEMVHVLTNMYGAKETVSSIQTKMEHLHLKDENSMASFLQFRDSFTALNSKIPAGELAADQRCRLFLKALPRSLNLHLTLHREEHNDVSRHIKLTTDYVQATEDARVHAAVADAAAAVQTTTGRAAGRKQPAEAHTDDRAVKV